MQIRVSVAGWPDWRIVQSGPALYHNVFVAEFLVVFSVVTGFITVWGGVVQALDYRMSRTVASTESFPIRIRRSISYSQYLRAIDQFRRVVGERHLVPDLVVGIQYSAMGPAAEIAKIWRLPVLRVEVTLREVGGSLTCEAVKPEFPLRDLAGKNVLVVDNNIRSGRTMREIVGLLSPHAKELRTCVLHRAQPRSGNFHEPDFVIFESKRRLKYLLR